MTSIRRHGLRSVVPLGALGCLLIVAADVQARPPYKKALAELLGPFMTAKLNDCRTCHVPEKPGDETDPLLIADKPHNAFGRRLKAIKAELKAAG
jgi:hypothetical protein